MITGSLAMLFLTLLGILHFYWAAGGKLGRDNVIPTSNGSPVLHPGPIATAIVGFTLLAMAGLLAVRMGWVKLSGHTGLNGIVSSSTWMIAGVFSIRAIGDFRYVGFCKHIRDSRFSRLDTLVYSPLCALIALLIICTIVE